LSRPGTDRKISLTNFPVILIKEKKGPWTGFEPWIPG